MIDFHCHLDLFPDPIAIVRGCIERGVYVLSVTTTPSAWEGTCALSDGSNRIRTALGLHPQLAHERYSELGHFDELLPRTQYVGEVGLDGAPEYRAHWDVQVRVFEHVLDSCTREGGRILSLHSRRATSAVLMQLKRFPKAGVPVLHWFTGTTRELEQAIALGCWFSVGPAMLKSERGRQLAGLMPRDRVLTESDGPFAQLDGSAVLPWHTEAAISELANIWGISQEDVANSLRNNLIELVTNK